MQLKHFKKNLILAALLLASTAIADSGKYQGAGGSGSGSVTGPSSSTDNAVARFDGINGKFIQNSGVIVDDSNNMSGVGTFGSSGLNTLGGLIQFTNNAHAITGANFQIGIDTQIGGSLRFNVPSAKNFSWSVNDTIEASLNSTTLNLINNNIVTTGNAAFGPQGVIGNGGGSGELRFLDVGYTVSDFSDAAQYPVYGRISVEPTTDLSQLTFGGYELTVNIPEANTHDIVAYNFSALEGFWNNYGSGDVNVGFGVFGAAANYGTGNITSELVGGYFYSSISGSGSVTGTGQKDGNFGVAVGTANYGSGYIARNFHYYAEKPYGTGEIKNNWGLYLEDQQVGTTDSWAIQTAGGKVQFGSPSGKDQILYLSDEDVAHGMTDLYPTDVFSVDTSVSSTTGGRKSVGLSDTDAIPFSIEGVIGTSSPSTTTPALALRGWKKNGTTEQVLGNSDLLLAVYNGTSITPAFSVTGNNTLTTNGVLSVGATITSPGAGGGSERFGASSLAAGAASVAIGNGASGAASNAIAIGFSTVAGTGSTNTIVIGSGISTTSADGVTIGTSASNWSRSVGVGGGVNAGGTDAVAIGYGASGGTQTIMLGRGVSGSGTNNIGIGYSASVTGSGGATDSIGIGANVVTGFGKVIALGSGATGTAANQFVLGSTTAPINDAYLGRGVTAAAPSTITLHATGGSTTGVNGADFVVAGGLGGAAADTGGSILFKTAPSGSGTTLATALTISSTSDAAFTGKVTSSRTTDIGWSIVTGANTDCNTTCTSACVHGWDTTAGVETAISCTDATADKCLCAGAN